MTHTPGPWLLSFGENSGYDCMFSAFDVVTPDSQTIAVLDCGQYGQEACFPLDPETKAQVEANAHLIVAAPELLDALKGLYDFHYRNRCDIEECGCASSQMAARVQTVIAKAEGR